MLSRFSKRQLFVGAAILGFVFGVVSGAVYVSYSKAARVADDLHDVKQDYDKAKGAVAEKAKKALEGVDTKELGEAATEGLKDLGRDTKEKAKDVTDAWQKMLKEAREHDAWRNKLKEAREKNPK